MIEWQDGRDNLGNLTREFRITQAGARDITGAVWLPERADPNSRLICCGHGASGDRYQAPIPYLANRFLQETGSPVLSLDGPVHGRRQVGEGGRQAFFPEFQRDDALRDMTRDWHAAIAAVVALPGVGKRELAYFGLSMGSIFGFPLIASRNDFGVAVLGLFGIQDSFPHASEFLQAAATISCPVLFLMQLEDELFSREGYLRAFDALGTTNKRIHANPGLHPEVPQEEIDFAFEFLIGARDRQRETAFVAS
ncbi:MAG: alpha/beta hydrolase [Pseudomonadota bacterium]